MKKETKKDKVINVIPFIVNWTKELYFVYESGDVYFWTFDMAHKEWKFIKIKTPKE